MKYQNEYMRSSTAILKSEEDIAIMREGGRILALILREAKEHTKIGMTTSTIDKYVGRLCLKYKVKPAFKGYQGYPANICISINEEIVHGIPSKERKIKSGDLVSLDFGVYYKGLNTDAAVTFGMGQVSEISKKIIEVTQKSFFEGLKFVKPGNTLGDVGASIQEYVERNGFSVVRSLAGHGIGRQVHESPIIPNYGKKGAGDIIREGMTLAIEPMVCEKEFEVHVLGDGWTYATVDGGLSSHFEHTILVTATGYEILTKEENS